MLTWDEIITRYELLERGAIELKRGKLAGCMVKILPTLRLAVETSAISVSVSLKMLALELALPLVSKAVILQCVEECQFRVQIINNKYEILKENTVDSSYVVAQTIQYLEILKQSE